MSTLTYRDRELTLRLSREAGLLVAVLVLHGPLDVGLTVMQPSLEANPAVAALGPTAWGVLKTALLAGLVGAYALARDHWAVWPVLVGALVVGVFAVTGNFLTLVVIGA